jgi:hypothetical protein
MHGDPKFGRRCRGVSYIAARRKKVPECHSGLRPEKELPEWHSGVFRQKNTPDFNIIHHLLLSPLFGYVRNSTCISCLSLPN